MLTTNIKKYDKYKDSGIEWIGKIQRNESLEAIFNVWFLYKYRT